MKAASITLSITRSPRRQGTVAPCSDHSQRVLVGVEQRVLLVAVGRVHLPERNDLPHGLDVVADALGLAVDVLDVASDGAALFLELLDPLDEALQALGRDRPGLGLLGNGASVRHVPRSTKCNSAADHKSRGRVASTPTTR